MVDTNTELPAGIFEKLKRLWKYWNSRLSAEDVESTTTTTAEEQPWAQKNIKYYIQKNKPPDIDEKDWLIEEMRRIESDKNVPAPFKKRFKQYVFTNYPEEILNSATGKKKKNTEPY